MLTLTKKLKTQTVDKQISITYRGLHLIGNRKDILLEQLEFQGIYLPYACRAGFCGTCKIKLLVGRVLLLTKNNITEASCILSCSCIPEDDLYLE
ncbi:2Fe-2S iron-sulfur cluster-binding protein [Candidatus Curculioniphilus buchneri]|uniref:2Fe-2S iron-sulfur cluster-binding protein n=1 Tax=Candidatus Curculioniphilus buchneri TaxID=690594 RepID=UPI00376EFE06